MIRREFLSKIGAVLATAATGATLAKAGDFKKPPQKKPEMTFGHVRGDRMWGGFTTFDENVMGRVNNLQIHDRLRKVTYKVQFKDGHVEYRTAHEKYGKYVIDPFDHRIFTRR